jgi:hypothetical protein
LTFRSFISNLGSVADELCVIRSLYCLSNNHSPAIFQMNSGNIRPGNPSLGSWVTYGLGTENQNLPSLHCDVRLARRPDWRSAELVFGLYACGFQGTSFRPGATPIVDLNPPKWVDPHLQRQEIDLIQKLNQQHREQHPKNSDLDARIASYELAFQMQISRARSR